MNQAVAQESDDESVPDFRLSRLPIAWLWKTGRARRDTSDEDGWKFQGTCQKWAFTFSTRPVENPVGKGPDFGGN
jgi:hypothetical protein